MRLFGKKSSTPAGPSGSAEAEAEAEAELRRAVEALGAPTAPDDAPPVSEPPPAAVDLSVEEEADDSVPAPAEADVTREEAQHDAGSDDQLPEELPAGEPARRRVRKTPPSAAQPARRRAAGGAAPRPRTSTAAPGATRQRRTST